MDDAQRFKEALEEIVNPLAFLRRRAEAEGARLSGMAYQIVNDPQYLRDIAKRALETEDS